VRAGTFYQGIVEDHLRALGMSEPPVEIGLVAERLGVPVLEVAFPPWFTAALIYEDGMPLILMNSRREPHTRRHALGHLLGHILLLLADTAERFPRNDTPSHPEADTLADELEMPSFMIRDQAQKWFNDYRYLAGLFGVSENRMFEKMRDLGIIRSRGIIWDY
jgi:Zn-dependent peptidase ImmA (M78 family)